MTNSNPEAVIEGVTQAETARCKAINSQDWDTLSELIHDDYTYTHTTGRVQGKEDWLESAEGFNSWEIERHSLSVNPFGNFATTTGDVTASRIRDDGERRGSTSPILHIWVNEGDRWQLLAHYTVKRSS